jgi:hypothetical protein
MGHLRIGILDFPPFENDWLDAEFIALSEYELKNFALIISFRKMPKIVEVEDFVEQHFFTKCDIS